ncbi:MAG: HRDC domain-containing protein, partial [Janthinobacterium lividum]
ILRNETTVMLREEADAPAGPARSRAKRDRVAAGSPTVAGDDPLFDVLRTWRSGEAKAQSVPPYVIFHDSVLREIATARPSDMDQLGDIKGVGGSKLSRYGAAVLAIVRKQH